MRERLRRIVFPVGGLLGGFALVMTSVAQDQKAQPKAAPRDAVAEAQTSRDVQAERPEQKKSEHDRSDIFTRRRKQSLPLLPSKISPTKGESLASIFTATRSAPRSRWRHSRLSRRPTSPTKPKVMADQRKLLESRYNLEPKLDPQAKMSRGKPLPVGPDRPAGAGYDWDDLAAMSPDEIRTADAFPYPSPASSVKQGPGGQVFPKMQIEMFPRLERFDVDFDLPEAFLPEFPPAIVPSEPARAGRRLPRRGRVDQQLLSAFQGHPHASSARRPPSLLTPFPQEEFNPTDDRKSAEPSLGVTCFDCHVNGHTTGQFHLNPDIRPEERRLAPRHGEPAGAVQSADSRVEAEPALGRGLHRVRAAHGLLQRRRDSRHEEGVHEHSGPQSRSSHMAQMQNMLDFPPAPKLNTLGRLDPAKATESELRGETIFFGKGQCSACHPAPFYLDNQMHDLHLERFLKNEPGDGPIKSFTLRGIKDSPPYMHDGRCLTLEDTVEFFNLVLELKLTTQEKADLVAFLRQL